MTREPDGERIARLEEQSVVMRAQIAAIEAKIWWALTAAVGALTVGVWQMLPSFVKTIAGGLK